MVLLSSRVHGLVFVNSDVVGTRFDDCYASCGVLHVNLLDPTQYEVEQVLNVG